MPRLCTQIGDRCKFTDDSCCMKQQTVGQKEKQNKTTKSICSWGEGLGLRTQNFDRRNVGYKRAKLYILFRNSPGELAVDTGSQSSSVVFPHTACRRPLQLPLPRATSTAHRSTSRSVFFSSGYRIYNAKTAVTVCRDQRPEPMPKIMDVHRHKWKSAPKTLRIRVLHGICLRGVWGVRRKRSHRF